MNVSREISVCLPSLEGACLSVCVRERLPDQLCCPAAD